MKTSIQARQPTFQIPEADCFRLSPEKRLEDIFSPDGMIYPTAASLNKAILDLREIKVGDDVTVFQWSRDSGEILVVGGDYQEWYLGELRNFATDVFQTIAMEKHVDTTAKLRAVARAMGVLISNGQFFPQGNHSTARTMAGGIAKGYDYLAKAHNAQMSFDPPEGIEDSIKKHYICSPAVSGELSGKGSDYQDIMQRARDELDRIKAQGAQGTSWDEKYYAIYRAIGSRSSSLILQEKAALVLAQRDFGDCAFAIAMLEPDIATVDEKAMKRIIDVNNGILLERLKCLVRSVVAADTGVLLKPHISYDWPPMPDFDLLDDAA